jgi:hypothetical protein
MPILRYRDKTIYYAHIPKCAGSSVEDYLQDRFGPLDLLDRGWHSRPDEIRRGRSSPQHMTLEALYRQFPSDMFDLHFAMVRHPARRLISAFLHNRNHRLIDPFLSLDGLLRFLEDGDPTIHRNTDNHFLPATAFVDSSAKVFRLEDGGGDLIRWLDALAGDSDGPRELPRSNEKSAPPAEAQSQLRNRIISQLQPQLPALGRPLLARIAAIYSDDFDRFGYDPFSI